jgi:hypothetical protein
MKKSSLLFLFIILAFALSATADKRPIGMRGVGPRIGVTINPD